MATVRYYGGGNGYITVLSRLGSMVCQLTGSWCHVTGLGHGPPHGHGRRPWNRLTSSPSITCTGGYAARLMSVVHTLSPPQPQQSSLLLPRLEKLNLAHNNIGPAGARAIYRACQVRGNG